jgi:hypothetical protein
MLRDEAIEAAWTIGLAPDAVEDYARPIELATGSVAALDRIEDNSADFRKRRNETRRVLAAVLLRAGRLNEAQAELASAAAHGDSDNVTDLLVAITHARAAQISQAEARLAKALTGIAATASQSISWQEKAELDLLTAEARLAIQGHQ